MIRTASQLVAITLVFLSMACSDVSVEFVQYADKACGCSDVTCAKKVLDEFAEFLRANKNKHGDADKTNEASARLGKCLMAKGIDPKEMMKTLEDAAQ